MTPAVLLPPRPTELELRAVPSLKAAVHDLDRRRARSRQKKIGASEVGECRRRAAYVIEGRAKTNSPTGLQAALGTAIHKEFLRAMRRMHGGMIEVKVASEQLKGSADWLDEVIVEDLKTTSKGGYEKVLTRGPYTKHWYQVTLYAWHMRTGYIADRRLLNVGTDTVDVEGVRIRYLSRDSGDDTVYAQAYDPFLAAEAIAWLAEVYAEVEKHKSAEYVERDGFGPGIDSMCDYCPFLDACWGAPVEAEGETEESRQSRLTVTDEDFVQALLDYDESRNAESEAKRHKEYARERLRGRTGDGGGLHCAWTGGNERTSVDKEAALILLRDLLDFVRQNGIALPDGLPAEIPLETRRTRKAIKVTKTGTPTG